MNRKLLLLICLLTMSFAHAQLNSVALVGSGTLQGWPSDPQTDAAVMTSSDGVNWTINNVTLLNGAVKLRGNNSWALPYNWGGSTFPSGTAVVDANGITAVAGNYNVTFNSTTGVYNFVLQASAFPVISLIGDAAPGVAWTTDTDLTTFDGVNYSINRVPLVVGAIKFRQDHAWTPTTNWGGSTFSSGVGIVDGPAISVPANGTYNVTFNRNTLAYTFSFASVAIVGPGAGGWPNDPQIDANQMTTTNGIDYTLANMVLTADNAKFRANNSWSVNWGGTDFPSGVAVLDSPASFLCVAGTYNVTFNYNTGAYSFTDGLGTTDFDSSNLRVYPNPTQSNWNFSVINDTIENIQIVDVLGKIVINVVPRSESATIDASALNSGIYFARIATTTANKTVKLIRE